VRIGEEGEKKLQLSENISDRKPCNSSRDFLYLFLELLREFLKQGLSIVVFLRNRWVIVVNRFFKLHAHSIVPSLQQHSTSTSL